jgi:exodeoxyribonuclease V beta subunit
MTRSFNVLDPNETIHQSYLLEASAGTGKTFAIENIIVRKLLEGEHPLKLEEMIVVTFTKAAVADLKRRIYKNIKNAYSRLRDPRLDDALQTFHEASIYTIHGFCQRMLQESGVEGGALIHAVGDLPISLYKRIMTDYIQVIFNSEYYSLRQLEKLRGNNSIEALITDLIHWVKKGVPALENPPLSEQKKHLEKLWSACGEDPIEMIKSHIPNYKNLTQIDEWINQPINGNDFDALLALADHVLEKFNPENKKVRVKNPTPLPAELVLFRDTALHYISKSHLLSDLIEKCRQHLEHYCQMEDLTPFDLLLKKMERCCSNPQFVEGIRQKYKLAIVDEFQDTDHVQWSIFKSIFLDKGQLILVGDPKQSIYGFRQADIYTYQSAANSLGSEALRSLDTNFRSTAPLIGALNALFDANYTPGWIPLPKTSSTMTYQPVKVGRLDEQDEGGLIVQIADLEEDLYLAIANTIIEKKLSLHSTAILVKDRFQASKIAKILQDAHIPFVLQKQELLTKTEAWNDWLTILTAIQQPKNRSLVKCALGTTLIGFTHLEIRNLDDEDKLFFYMEQFIALKKCWFEKGLSSVSEKINSQLIFKSDGNSPHHPQALTTNEKHLSLRNRLLMCNGGDLYLHHLEQIQDILMEEESKDRLSPQELISRAKELQDLSSEEDNRLLSIQDHVQEGVRILTIHLSKGLEFETVFTPGILQKGSFRDELVPLGSPQSKFVPFLSKSDPLVQSYLEEYDAEKMRQLYVALTRAKKWLYLPFISSGDKVCKHGDASPIQLFFARMGRPLHLNSQALYETINSLSAKEIERVLPKHSAITTQHIKTENLKTYISKKQERPITTPTIPTIPGHATFIDSFTSLSLGHTKNSSQQPPRTESRKDPIPAGTETGIILHKIFEYIDFTDPKPLPYIQGTILEPWSAEIESLVLSATCYQFPEGFSLADIPIENQFREMEFLYPSPSGYIKGVIDLIFCYNDKIHILDWKSNLLHDYTNTSLQESMEQHNYFLQAKLYKEAALRYFGDLPIIIDYFFVRGSTSYRLALPYVE